MSSQDKSLQCSDCGATFTFTAEEQEFFVAKGFSNEPERCPSCRQASKAERCGYGAYRTLRQMFRQQRGERIRHQHTHVVRSFAESCDGKIEAEFGIRALNQVNVTDQQIPCVVRGEFLGDGFERHLRPDAGNVTQRDANDAGHIRSAGVRPLEHFSKLELPHECFFAELLNVLFLETLAFFFEERFLNLLAHFGDGLEMLVAFVLHKHDEERRRGFNDLAQLAGLQAERGVHKFLSQH